MSNQRVNIQFTIDMDDLPSEASRLICKSCESVQLARDNFQDLEFEENPLSVQTLKKIEDIRLCLAKSDAVLEDLTKIITGYLRLQVEPPQQRQQQATPQQTDSQNVVANKDPQSAMMPNLSPFGDHGSLEDFQAKVKKFTENLESTRNEKPPESTEQTV